MATGSKNLFKMKKVLFTIALCVVTTMTFAVNTADKSAANKVNQKNVILLFDNCGLAGDAVYDLARSEGATHRQARRSRRAFVRNCRR